MGSEKYSLDEVKKVFPDFPKTLPEKLAEDEDQARELEEFLIQRSKTKMLKLIK